jgi:pimeloyl-ACP methyl ester carboxylesterase
MNEPESRYFESMRLRLHYAVWGDESKPAVVMVHGGRDHARSWDFVADKLTDQYACYAQDLRGHGDSDWAQGGGYSLSAYVADLAQLIEALGRPNVALIGHSLGGRIVLDYAAAFPERVSKVVAIEGFGRIGSRRRPVDQLRSYVKFARELEPKRPLPYKTLEAAEQRMREENRRLTPEMVTHLTRHAARRREDGSYVWKFDIFGRLSQAPDWDAEATDEIWRQLKVPVLQVGGSDSWGHRFMDRVELAKAVPGQRIVILDGAGHWVQHDRLDEFVALTREFLSES